MAKIATVEKEAYDLIIIGSGPAGLSAAVYGRRAGFSTLVLESAPMSGGQVLNTYEVDNYLGLPGMNGFDMGMKFREHADKLGAEFAEGDVGCVREKKDYKEVETSKATYRAQAVIIAAGARHRTLDVPGEEQFAGRGVSYCATCDGAFFRDKTVAVVGGGDVAVEDAIFLSRNCKKVYLIHRRGELRAAKILQEQLFTLENVETVFWNTVDEIRGDSQVRCLLLHDKEKGSSWEIEVDGVFIAVGIRPGSEAFVGLVETDDDGYLKASEDCVTSVPGIFAAGDIRTKKLRQIVTAVADGANAVASAQQYMAGLKMS